MGVVIKQSFWGSALAYLGVLLGFFNTIYLRPAYLDLDEIGLLMLVVSNALLLAPFVTLGMPSTYLKYFPYFQDNLHLDRQFFSFQLLVILLACVFTALAALVGMDWIENFYSDDAAVYNEYLFVSFLILVLHSLFIQLHAFSKVHLNVILPNAIKEVQLRIGNIILILAYSLGWVSFDLSVKLLTLNYLAALLIQIVYLMVSYQFRLTLDLFSLPKLWIRKMFYFGGYNLLLAGSNSIYSNISFMMIPAMLGMGQNGIYSICFYIGIIIEMPKRSMLQVISPIVSGLFKNNDIKGIEELYKKASLTLSVISTLFFIGILCNLNDLFLLIPKGPQLSQGFYVVIGVGLAKIIDLAFSINSDILIYSKYYKFNLYFFILTALLMLGLNYWLINLLGINGAAIAFLASTIFFNVLKFVLIKVKFHISPFTKGHFHLGISSLIISVFFWYLPLTDSVLLNLALRSVLITIFYIGLIYKLEISADVNGLVKSLVLKVINKK